MRAQRNRNSTGLDMLNLSGRWYVHLTSVLKTTRDLREKLYESTEQRKICELKYKGGN